MLIYVLIIKIYLINEFLLQLYKLRKLNTLIFDIYKNYFM